MMSIEILINIVLLALAGPQMVQAVPVEKWFELSENQTIFIERDYKYNWFQARNECLLKNMTLITVETSDKSTALTTLLKRIFAKSRNLWIGGDDLAEQGVFTWSTTGKRFEFTNWSLGNPSHNHDLEHCVNIWDATDFEWNDAPCTELKGFICEENVHLVNARQREEHMIKLLHEVYENCE